MRRIMPERPKDPPPDRTPLVVLAIAAIFAAFCYIVASILAGAA